MPHENDPTENPDPRDAVRALRESREATTHTDEIIVESQRLMAGVRRVRQENHFTDTFRRIIQGV